MEKREELIINNINLVHSIARKYYKEETKIPYQDLVQEGTIGLIKAVDKFDPNKGELSTYATFWIRNFIFRALERDNNNLSNTNRAMLNLFRKIDKISLEIQQKEGEYRPTDEQIKKHIDFKELVKDLKIRLFKGSNKEDTILRLYRTDREFRDVILFDDLAYNSDYNSEEDFNSTAAITNYPSLEEDFTQNYSRKDFVNFLMDQLTYKEQKVIRLYYGLDNNIPKTLTEIGSILKLTKSAISLIHKKALKKLKEFEPEYIEPN